MGRGAGWKGQMKKVEKKWAVSMVQHVLWMVAVRNMSWMGAVRGSIRLSLQWNPFEEGNERRRTNGCLHVLITDRPTCLSAFCLRYSISVPLTCSGGKKKKKKKRGVASFRFGVGKRMFISRKLHKIQLIYFMSWRNKHQFYRSYARQQSDFIKHHVFFWGKSAGEVQGAWHCATYYVFETRNSLPEQS